MKKQKRQKVYYIERVFLKEPWKPLTYSEIQKLSKSKSKGHIYSILNNLEKNKRIEKKRIGKRTVIYHPKLDTASSQSYWGFLSENISWLRKIFPFHIIENLRARITTPFFILLVAGSYAKGAETKESDLDVVVIVNDHSEHLYSELKHEAEMSLPKVHLYVFSKKDFLDMLLAKKDNYGKEIARNSMIFAGGSAYYSLLNEAIEHGFKS